MSSTAPTDGAPDLREIAQAARASGRIALDTEFMGEGRYRTLLCLVQLAIPQGAGAGERIEIVDPLAEDLDGAKDRTPAYVVLLLELFLGRQRAVPSLCPWRSSLGVLPPLPPGRQRRRRVCAGGCVRRIM